MLSGANVMKMLVGDYEPPAERPGQNLILSVHSPCLPSMILAAIVR